MKAFSVRGVISTASTISHVLSIVVCVAIIVAAFTMVHVAARRGVSPAVDVHVDVEHGVVCYTTAQGHIACMYDPAAMRQSVTYQ